MEEAVFIVLGAIALQGIRLVQPTLGETVVVTGLGLIGLMTCNYCERMVAECLGWISMPTNWPWPSSLAPGNGKIPTVLGIHANAATP